MFSGNDSLPTAVLTAKEQDLKPLVEESAEALDLDQRQTAAMASHLHDAWFLGIKMGHEAMVEARMGQTDPRAAVLSTQGGLQELMERCAEALNATVGVTIAAWNYLGQAWIAGARFWEVEIAARLIEAKEGSFDQARRRLEE